MPRSIVIFLVILIALASGAWYLSTVDTEVETRTIEVPVTDNALEG